MKTGVSVGLDIDGIVVQVGFQPEHPDREVGAVYFNLCRVEAEKLRDQLTNAIHHIDN